MKTEYSVIAHLLRIFGNHATEISPDCGSSSTGRIVVVADADHENVCDIFQCTRSDDLIVLIRPRSNLLDSLGVQEIQTLPASCSVQFPSQAAKQYESLRSLNTIRVYHCDRHREVVAIAGEYPCWICVREQNRTILIVGTDLVGDLTRYRQGDPANLRRQPAVAMYGVAGERPNYLFEGLFSKDRRFDRQADYWCTALSSIVSEYTRSSCSSILPNGAGGAVIVTGDDDQAYLENYEKQLQLLQGVCVTYFLHPKTRHTRDSLRRMMRRHKVEFGIHPDALDAPEKYYERLDEQVAWFRSITGSPPRSARNHGFLNDGYWGHLNAWLKNGIEISSNLPGVDGTILNGSLLPARVSYGGVLTEHWSVLTAIGDGIRFAMGKSGPESAQCIFDLAGSIKNSRIPGVIVLNLHPENVEETREMHTAVVELIHNGFLPMTIGECLDWFSNRDKIGQKKYVN